MLSEEQLQEWWDHWGEGSDVHDLIAEVRRLREENEVLARSNLFLNEKGFPPAVMATYDEELARLRCIEEAAREVDRHFGDDPLAPEPLRLLHAELSDSAAGDKREDFRRVAPAAPVAPQPHHVEEASS